MKIISKLKKQVRTDKNFAEIIKHSTSSFGMRILGLFINYLFLFFVTKNYGSKGWGIFALCFSILQIASMIGTLGINVALIKIIPQGTENSASLYKKVLKFIIPFNLIISIIIFCFSNLISNLLSFDKVSISTHIRIMSMGILPFSISMINSAVFRANKEILRFSFYDSLGRFLWGGLCVLAIHFFTFNSYAVIEGFVIGLYLLCIISFRPIQKILKRKKEEHRKKANINDQQGITYSNLRNILRLSTPLFWANFIFQGSIWATTLILGIFISKEQVGIFDAVNRFASLITIILYAVNSISAPKFAESFSNVSLLKKNVQNTSKLIFFTTIPLFFIMLATAPYIFQFLGFYEDSSISHATVFIIFFIILLGQLINNLSGSVVTLMQMIGYHVLNQNISLISFIGTTISLFFVTPLFGLVGASVVVGLNIAFKNIASVIAIYRKTKILTVYYPSKRLNAR